MDNGNTVETGTNTYAIIILVIGILLFLIGLFALFYYWDSATGIDSVSLWIWLLLGLGFTLMLIGGVWWMFWGSSTTIIKNVDAEIKGLESRQDQKISTLTTDINDDKVIILEKKPVTSTMPTQSLYSLDNNSMISQNFVRPPRRLEAEYINDEGDLIREYSDCTIEKTIKYSRV